MIYFKFRSSDKTQFWSNAYFIRKFRSTDSIKWNSIKWPPVIHSDVRNDLKIIVLAQFRSICWWLNHTKFAKNNKLFIIKSKLVPKLLGKMYDLRRMSKINSWQINNSPFCEWPMCSNFSFASKKWNEWFYFPTF